MDTHEIEHELRLIERALAEPAVRGRWDAHSLAVQASWLLTALGRAHEAVTAADLAATCWRVARDAAPPSPYGGSMSWESGRAAAVAHMSIGQWRTGGERARRVLIDFAEEDKAFYLFELCLHAQGKRPWNRTQSFVILKNPSAQLAAFDPRAYAVEQYRSHLGGPYTAPDPLDSDRDTSELDAPAQNTLVADASGANASEPRGYSWARWSGVPVPPDLVAAHQSAEQIHAERDPVIRGCAIAVYGPQRYTSDVEDLARQVERAATADGGCVRDPGQRQFLMDYTVRGAAAVVARAADPDTPTRGWGELRFALALLADPDGPSQWDDLEIPDDGWPLAGGPAIRSYRLGPQGGRLSRDGYELHWSFGADEVCDAVDHALDGGSPGHRLIEQITRGWPELARALHQLVTAHGRPAPPQWRNAQPPPPPPNPLFRPATDPHSRPGTGPGTRLGGTPRRPRPDQ